MQKKFIIFYLLIIVSNSTYADLVKIEPLDRLEQKIEDIELTQALATGSYVYQNKNNRVSTIHKSQNVVRTDVIENLANEEEGVRNMFMYKGNNGSIFLTNRASNDPNLRLIKVTQVHSDEDKKILEEYKNRKDVKSGSVRITISD